MRKSIQELLDAINCKNRKEVNDIVKKYDCIT